MAATDNFWGDTIVQLRQEKKVSQRALSANAKVNRSTLRRIEDGTAEGSIRMFERMLNHLGYELDIHAHESVVEKEKLQELQDNDPDLRSRIARRKLQSMGL